MAEGDTGLTSVEGEKETENKQEEPQATVLLSKSPPAMGDPQRRPPLYRRNTVPVSLSAH